MNAPVIEQLEFSKQDCVTAGKIATRLGYSQQVYTSTSGLWGLFCLKSNQYRRGGCVIKTKQFGFMFVADLEDMNMYDLTK